MIDYAHKTNPATYSLIGKVVLIITGYDQGGMSLALSLADFGADLALLCSPQTENGALKIQQQVAQNADVDCQVFQLHHPDQAHQTIHQVVDKMGSIDILLDCSQMEDDD